MCTLTCFKPVAAFDFVPLIFLKKLISISLALLLLVSNISFAINTHFCGGIAVKNSFSFGLHNPDCGMNDTTENCEARNSQSNQLKVKPCCENQHQLLNLDDNTNLHSASSSLSASFFVAFVHTFIAPNVFVEQRTIDNFSFLHPKPDKDLKVLFQSFLI